MFFVIYIDRDMNKKLRDDKDEHELKRVSLSYNKPHYVNFVSR